MFYILFNHDFVIEYVYIFIYLLGHTKFYNSLQYMNKFFSINNLINLINYFLLIYFSINF